MKSQKATREKKRKKAEHKLSRRIPSESSVFVDLHKISDENIKTERFLVRCFKPQRTSSELKKSLQLFAKVSARNLSCFSSSQQKFKNFLNAM